ncbi:serine hydrolase [Agrilutibacter solisilvae]|uniref:Serine hydrolase n=1 Tax=Agrilutibacter solisilvae TaxID=2763317 RepID=A0A974XZZ1_9GAMM|nr:serine hydrolase [Lysobacter solisilvae]QSX78065.1 serine hydrolase [Lysobacter solisilvae]
MLATSAAVACPAPPARAGGAVNAHTRFVEQNLFPAVMEAGAKPLSLSNRMQAYGVPGVSVAVIHKGKVDWARGWGVRDATRCKPVTADTAFQAASISKVVTAVLALRMVEQGRIGLDRDINAYLRSWQLPDAGTTSAAPVTLRRLLSHTAGLNVHGFPGYQAGAAVPTAVQVLNGQPPANTEAVRVISPPDPEWRYSGGGYVIAQVALEDVARTPFARLAENEIFRRVDMPHSAFSQPPSPAIAANAASGHIDGKVVANGYHVYPELGPAGLWTTAEDLAHMLLDLQAAADARPARLLSPAMAKAMLTPVKGQWGLGPALSGTGAGRRFGHDGVNEGFQSTMVAYVEKGEGVVVLTNGAGKRLADEIVRAVATDYGWTELASKPTIEAHLPTAALAALAGRYEGGGLSVYLDLRDSRLYANTGGPEPERLIALSADRFRTSASGIVVEFDRAPDGSPLGFRIVEGGPPISLARSAAPTSDPLAQPLFIRGSMNDWGTSAPLIKTADGQLMADLSLGAGEHQLKIGSGDWQTADFGLVGATAVQEPFGVLPLVPRGGNIRLQLAAPGTIRFQLKQAPTGLVLEIRRLEGD